MVAAAGVDVPAGEVLRRGDRPTVAPPAVVKPADADNSLGVTLVRSRDGYARPRRPRSRTPRRSWSRSSCRSGGEVRCGLVERDGELVGLPLEEYLLDEATRPVRSYDDKLAPDRRRRAAPGGEGQPRGADRRRRRPRHRPGVGRRAPLPRRARAAATTRSSTSASTPTGRPVFLEASLYCSFAPSSVLAVMAAAGGIALDELLATAVTGALKRRCGDARRRSRSRAATRSEVAEDRQQHQSWLSPSRIS